MAETGVDYFNRSSASAAVRASATSCCSGTFFEFEHRTLIDDFCHF